jgi:hypothetical protein
MEMGLGKGGMEKKLFSCEKVILFFYMAIYRGIIVQPRVSYYKTDHVGGKTSLSNMSSQ